MLGPVLMPEIFRCFGTGVLWPAEALFVGIVLGSRGPPLICPVVELPPTDWDVDGIQLIFLVTPEGITLVEGPYDDLGGRGRVAAMLIDQRQFRIKCDC